MGEKVAYAACIRGHRADVIGFKLMRQTDLEREREREILLARWTIPPTTPLGRALIADTAD